LTDCLPIVETEWSALFSVDWVESLKERVHIAVSSPLCGHITFKYGNVPETVGLS